MANWVKKFQDIHIQDIPVVGGKNASLGEMITTLASKGIKVPAGFATTADAFWHFIDSNKIREQLQGLMARLDKSGFSNLAETGRTARQLILDATVPADVSSAVIQSYKELCGDNYREVAVRSSATAEDLPDASFAGQHESYLNIKGEEALLKAVQACFASLYTDRAIK
ncbi:MAG TPA: PEP/pyruvate-binding domain-containing protein, partial [Chitinophagaceae bacterium]|nr:PEP/pyruvate-binding domain-containing protein [Chitinophagaceae bacterium]